MLLAGRTQKLTRAALASCLEADSEDAARGIQEADPAITSGLMRAELAPYRVALMPK